MSGLSDRQWFYQQFCPADFGPIVPLGLLPADWDPDAHLSFDGEWHAVVKLPHEVAEFEGYGVPAFEGDPERIAWEKRRAENSNPTASRQRRG